MHDLLRESGLISDYSLVNYTQTLANYTRALSDYTKTPLHDSPT